MLVPEDSLASLLDHDKKNPLSQEGIWWFMCSQSKRVELVSIRILG
jgi:hypothetical protein